jgi:hypothetical protein
MLQLQPISTFCLVPICYGRLELESLQCEKVLKIHSNHLLIVSQFLNLDFMKVTVEKEH